jgi:hypothetical protein
MIQLRGHEEFVPDMLLLAKMSVLDCYCLGRLLAWIPMLVYLLNTTGP